MKLGRGRPRLPEDKKTNPHPGSDEICDQAKIAWIIIAVLVVVICLVVVAIQLLLAR